MEKDNIMSDQLSVKSHHHVQTLSEEIANAITHGIGTALSIVGLTILVVMAVMLKDTWRVVAVSIYGGTLVFLYLASTLYHSFQFKPVKQVFHVMDHIGIFFLIAGTYTPILLIRMRDTPGWILLIGIWTLAIVGGTIKAFFTGQYTKFSSLIYIVMGWAVIFRFQAFASAIDPGGLSLVLAGGLSYTIGVIPFLWNRLPYNHAIWHLFVIGGSVCHYLAILRYILPMS
jgi:hemolysin III